MARAGTLGIVILAVSTLIAFLSPFLLITVTGVLTGIYYVSASRNLECEHSTTNRDSTVDQITDRRSCKRTCSSDLKTVEEMGQYSAPAFQNRGFVRQLMVDEDDEGIDARYLVVHLKSSGSTLLVFNPNEKVPVAIRPFSPRQVSVDAFRRS